MFLTLSNRREFDSRERNNSTGLPVGIVKETIQANTSTETPSSHQRTEAGHSSNQNLVQLLLVGSLIFSACAPFSSQPIESQMPPAIQVRAILPNEDNHLSAMLRISGWRGVAMAEIAGDSLLEPVTPRYLINRSPADIPILGLRPHSFYNFRVIDVSSTHSDFSSLPVRFITSSVPDDIPKLNVLMSHSPTVRYIMLGFTPAKGGSSYAVIVDVWATPVWYKRFGGAVVDFQKQVSGRYTAWSSLASSAPHFYEFDGLGTVTNEYTASAGLETDPHELRMSGSGYAVLGVQSRTMDLRSVGGPAASTVKGFVVEYRRAGRGPFLWSTFDHFRVSDAASDIILNGSNADPWHANAIEIDDDGNLLVSFRNSDEITKINPETGDIIWRLGGRNNQFAFRNDDLHGFSHQHGIRRLENGHIILFDNGNLHSPPISRAVEYRLDEKARIAELVWEYRPNPPIVCSALGFAQRLSNGNTLICFGTAQRIIEVDREGTKRLDIAVNEQNRYSYRAMAIESLY